MGEPKPGITTQEIKTLVYTLGLLGERWPLANHSKRVLDAASLEQSGGLRLGTLPVEFWDLQYLALDITEASRSQSISDGEGVKMIEVLLCMG
jgi:hypothetical protein